MPGVPGDALSASCLTSTFLCKAVIFCEIKVRVKEHLDILMTIFPRYLSVISQILSVNRHHLRSSILCSCLTLPALVHSSDFAASSESHETFVSVNAAALFSVAKDASYTC